MARWTPQGSWIMRLGAGFEVSWWDDQCGMDFLLETQARRACRGLLDVYAQQVLRLQWTAAFWKEQESSIRTHGLPDEKSPWYSLGMMQRCILAAASSSSSNDETTTTTNPWPRNPRLDDDPCIEARIHRIRLHKHLVPPEICRDDGTTIVIPAATCSSPPSASVLFVPSFLGGQQLFLKEDAVVEYTLPSSVVVGTAVSLSVVIATAHRFEQNLIVQCGGGDDDDTPMDIPMKYTMALWDETEPVTIHLTSNRLMVKRRSQPFGIALREIRLVRIKGRHSS
jgi:hypothetical protein